jgi:hypothetical protein
VDNIKLPFTGTYLTFELNKKFEYLCFRKRSSKSKMLLSLIMAATKNITLDMVNFAALKKENENPIEKPSTT